MSLKIKDYQSGVVHKEHQNKTHPMTLLMQKIAAENDIGCTLLDGGRIVRLEKNGIVKLIKGNNLPVNSSSSVVVCKDKAACSDVLDKNKIPHVRHSLFLNPALGDWIPEGGSWPAIHKYGEENQYNVVCKPKKGSVARDIRHITNARDFEKVVMEIFKTNRDVVLCPFQKHKYEYCVLIYKEQSELILRKSLPIVIGDGEQTLSGLIDSFLSQMEPSNRAKLIKLIPQNVLCSKEIPKLKEEITLHWINDGPGAVTEILGGATYYHALNQTNKDSDYPLRKKLVAIALDTVKAIGVRFACVNIAEIPEDSEIYRILEVNSTLPLDHKMDKDVKLAENLEMRIYTKIIRDLFHSQEELKEISWKFLDGKIPEEASKRKTHQLAKILSQIAAANGLKFLTYSQDWIIHLTKEDKVRLVFGYTFPLNNSASAAICGNKPATSAVLKHANIAQIRHHRIALPDPEKSGAKTNGLLAANAFASKHDFNIVCKPADGSGGKGVEHVKTAQELDRIVCKLLNNGEMAVCNFKKIRFEYRWIMLNGEAEVIFRKVPPFVIGDGKRSLRKLAAEKFLEEKDPKKREKVLENMDAELLVSDTIPALNEKVYLHWKHNLGQGATGELLGGKSYLAVSGNKEEMTPDLKEMEKIAKRTVEALNVHFVSVDIAEIEKSSLVPNDSNALDAKKEFRVMEVNSGVVMSHLMEQNKDLGIRLVMMVYTKALASSFNRG